MIRGIDCPAIIPGHLRLRKISREFATLIVAAEDAGTEILIRQFGVGYQPNGRFAL
jgi:hypothetical protein